MFGTKTQLSHNKTVLVMNNAQWRENVLILEALKLFSLVSVRYPKFSVIFFHRHLFWLSSSSFGTKESRQPSFTLAIGICTVENSSSDTEGNEKSPNTKTKVCY